MTSLFDQSALIDLAERLIAAARRAGADAADAVAVRSISLSVEMREGAVEDCGSHEELMARCELYRRIFSHYDSAETPAAVEARL